MRDNRKFQKGSGVYTCINCGKQTRETGDGESSVEMCAACYELGGMENMHSDDGHEGNIADCAECREQMSEAAIARMLEERKPKNTYDPRTARQQLAETLLRVTGEAVSSILTARTAELTNATNDVVNVDDFKALAETLHPFQQMVTEFYFANKDWKAQEVTE